MSRLDWFSAGFVYTLNSGVELSREPFLGLGKGPKFSALLVMEVPFEVVS